jgi:MFS superfamily sulfate permease-like transporter/carbonic anhydrase
MFTLQNLRKDIPASIVVFLVAVPLCLGIALASGAPLFSGLISGIIGGLVVGWMSGSHTSVSGPAAGLSAVVLAEITNLGSFETFLLAVVLAGVIQVVLGVARAGFISDYVPTNVVKGLLAAIGIILILKQLPHAIGYDSDVEGDFSFMQPDGLNTFSELLVGLSNFAPAAIIISVISLALLIGWDKSWLRRLPIPSALAVVLVGMALNEWLFAGSTGLRLAGNHLVTIPISDAGALMGFFDNLSFPNWAGLANQGVYTAAITIAVVATIETLVNLEAIDKLDPQKRHAPPNRELIAQGAGNILSGLVGGLPVTSVIVRSSANIDAGAQTKASTMMHGGLLLVFVVIAPGILNMIPLASLAAILLVTGYKLASVKMFRDFYAKGMNQFIPFITTVVAIVFTDLLIGTLLGLACSVFFLLRANFSNSFHERHEIHPQGEVIRLKLSQEVSFLNRGALLDRLSSLPANSNVVLDASDTQFIDHDVLEIIREFDGVAAKNKDIRLTLLGFRDRYTLADKVEWVNVLTKDSQQKLTPDQVLQHLREGNQRFADGNPLERDYILQASNTTQGQYPMAAVLSCIDSRTSAELVFDVGLGDLFSIRIAGNIANEDILGSMEFATLVAGAKLIVVLGHTGCGAVKAACDHVELGNLSGLLRKVDPAINRETITVQNRTSKNDDFVYNVTQLNVMETMKFIKNSSEIIKKLVEEGQIKIVGGMYDLDSRRVDFIDSNQTARIMMPRKAS